MEGVVVTNTAAASGCIRFEINPRLDPPQLTGSFRVNRRLRLGGFLNPDAAEALYNHIDQQSDWSLFLISKGKIYEAPPRARMSYTPEQEQKLIDLAVVTARERGFAYIYEGSPSIPATPISRAQDASLVARFADFANSDLFLEFIRSITGVGAIARADVHAIRFRSGHFITFRDATRSADRKGKRRATYFYNLTPEWKSEWGGLLEFKGKADDTVEGYIPCFNCLDIIAFPLGHWIGAVAPFADGQQYVLTGGLYAE